MAMIGSESPRHSSDNLQSSRSPVSSPWNQVVRGESESEPFPAVFSSPPSEELFPSVTATVDDFISVVESFDYGGERNGGTDKRPAWNKLSSNGESSEVRAVMDAHSWPALSDSARVFTKSESSKGLLDGSSVPQSQGLESTPSSSQTQRQVEDHVNLNNMAPTRQKLIKHNSSNASSNGGHTQPSAPQVAIAAMGSHNFFSKDHTQRSGSVSSDHPHQRNSFRNRSNGPHQRGDGSHHHNYGNRRDQDWNSRRNFNGRDMHVPPRVSPRIIRPSLPPNSAQFIHPQSLRPFGGHMGFHELAPPVVFVGAPPPPPPLDSLRGVPFVPPMAHPTLYYAGLDPQWHSMIVSQIEYYFSNENLVRDTFLRQKMDDQGWVPIKLIAGFKKVMLLTDNIQLIIDAVRTSSVVEVQGDKIRRKVDWKKWVIPPPVQFHNVKTPGVLTHDELSEEVHNISLETTTYAGAGGQVLPDSQSTGQVGLHGSDDSISTRN